MAFTSSQSLFGSGAKSNSLFSSTSGSGGGSLWASGSSGGWGSGTAGTGGGWGSTNKGGWAAGSSGGWGSSSGSGSGWGSTSGGIGGWSSSGGAGSSLFGGGSSATGTRRVAYRMTKELAEIGKPPMKYVAICFMPEYASKSLDELRYDDYLKGDKGGPSPGQQSGSLWSGFGASGGSGSSVFGSGSASGWGPSSGFGQQSTNAFGSAGSNSLFGSGSSSNPAFGTSGAGIFSSGSSGFGSSTGAFGLSRNTGGFGTNTGFGSSNTGFGSSSNTGFGASSSSGFGKPLFGGGSSGFGGGFGSSNSGFGTGSAGFGSSGSGFGGSGSGFGSSGSAFGSSGSGFGSGGLGFGGGSSAFGSSTNTGFGSKAGGSGGLVSGSSNTGSLFGSKPSGFGGPGFNTGKSGFGGTGFGSSGSNLFGSSMTGTTGFGSSSGSNLFGSKPSGFGGFGASGSSGSSLFGGGYKPSSLFGGGQSGSSLFGGSAGLGPTSTFGQTAGSLFGGSSSLFGSTANAQNSQGPLMTSLVDNPFGTSPVIANASKTESSSSRSFGYPSTGTQTAVVATKPSTTSNVSVIVGARPHASKDVPPSQSRVVIRRPVGLFTTYNKTQKTFAPPGTTAAEDQPYRTLPISRAATIKKLVIDPNYKPASPVSTSKSKALPKSTSPSNLPRTSADKDNTTVSQDGTTRIILTNESPYSLRKPTPSYAAINGVRTESRGDSSSSVVNQKNPDSPKPPVDGKPLLRSNVTHEVFESPVKNPTAYHMPGQAISPVTGKTKVYTTYEDFQREKVHGPAKNEAPILTKEDYYSVPSIAELQAYTSEQLAAVPEFTVGRHGVGRIVFTGETDVRNLNLDEIIDLDNRTVGVYADQKRPPKNTGLNKHAIVTLEGIWRSRGGQPRRGAQETAKMVKKLKKHCAEIGVQFLGYDESNGGWTFASDGF